MLNQVHLFSSEWQIKGRGREGEEGGGAGGGEGGRREGGGRRGRVCL